uniref:CNNM transmembrane domain-containing protein n=1 Tax=Strongyloides venezuelensis TaxID=75913 RepID=A0A0K0FHU5_STRVS
MRSFLISWVIFILSNFCYSKDDSVNSTAIIQGSHSTNRTFVKNDTEIVDPYAYEWESDKVVPVVCGMRAESVVRKGHVAGFLKSGVSVVEANVPIKLSVFGRWLERVEMISFTIDNCYHLLNNISHTEFLFQSEMRIEFITKFEKIAESKTYRMCISEKDFGQDGYEDMAFMIDEQRTWISTDVVASEYLLPLHIQILLICLLFILSALFSGLNLGLMALSPQELTLLKKSGSEKEKEYATIILPVRQAGNYLLCTILIMNVIVNSAISILFEDITSGYIAFIVSSIGIVVLGEIFPQSLCIKKGLAVGAHTIWLTRFFMFLTFPLSFPIGKTLDWLLGEDIVVYDKNQVLHLMKLTPSWETGNTELAADLKIAVGAMEISDKTVKDIMTNIEDVFMLSENTILNPTTITEILKKGYSRIPVYSADNNKKITSLLFVKDLALVDPEDKFTVKTICQYYQHHVRFVSENTGLQEMLDEFKKGEYHLAFVTTTINQEMENFVEPIKQFDRTSFEEEYGPCDWESDQENLSMIDFKVFEEFEEEIVVIGIVTLEDILEEILQAEIVDESDVILDNVYKRKRKIDKANNCYKMVEYDEICKNVSNSLTLACSQFLGTRSFIFRDAYLDINAFHRIISSNVRIVNFHKAPLEEISSLESEICMCIIKERVPCDKMILILEGSCIVSFSGTQLEFTVGPFEFFGCSMVKILEECISTNNTEKLTAKNIINLRYIPDFSLKVTHYCRYLQLTPLNYTNVYRITKAIRMGREINSKKLSIHSTDSVSFEKRLSFKHSIS